MRHFLSIIFGAAFTCAAAWSIGRFLFSRLRISLRRIEHELLAGVTGAAILSLVVFSLCAAAHRRDSGVLGRRTRCNRFELEVRDRRLSPAPADPLPRFWKWLSGSRSRFTRCCIFRTASLRRTVPDGQAYHLGLVYRYFRQHGFERLTTNMYGNLSQGMEMLYLFAFSFGRHAAAATLHCCFLFALPLTAAQLRDGASGGLSRALARACWCIFRRSPASMASALTTMSRWPRPGLPFFIWLRSGAESKQAALLIPIGLVAGFLLCDQVHGFCRGCSMRSVSWRGNCAAMKRMLLSVATLAGLVTLMAAPWLLKNWIWLGNPLSPFLNRVFPNPFTHISFEDEYRRYFRTYDLPTLKPLFWMVTVTGQLGGQLGPVFLLTPLALLGLRKAEGRRVLLAGLFFLLPYPQNLGARFLIPCLPYAALGIALALEFSPGAQAAAVMLAALLAWPKIIDRYGAPGRWKIADAPWKAALGIIPQDRYLLQRDPTWVTARMLDEFVPDGKRVWSTSPVAEAYSATEVLVSYYSAEGELIQDILTTAVKPNYQPLWNFRYTFSPSTLTHVRLLQSAESGTDIWSIGEIQFFLGSEEIRPATGWKMNSSSFPWDIGLAFDRNPVTRWRSWEPIHPGMWIDVDFGAPVELDRVELHSFARSGKDRCETGRRGCQLGEARRHGTAGSAASGDSNREEARYRLSADHRRSLAHCRYP